MANRIEIRLLGALEVQRDGEVVALPASKKTRALIAYLVVTARPHTRERLCELLWEGPDDPRAALRWSLTKLRPILGDHLETGRDTIEFVAGDVVIDLQLLRDMTRGGIESMTIPDLRSAAGMFRGEFLDGLELADCYRFHEWCVGERESLRRTYISLLDRLVSLLGPGPEGLRYARQRVMIDPFSEHAHIGVMDMLASLGQNQDALRQYDHCKALFERELGSRPSEALEQSRRAIGRTQDSRSKAVAAAPMPREAPLVGREHELALIDKAMAARSRGESERILFFSGEPGIGKSRMLKEIERRVRAGGGVALYGRGFAAEMVRPYGVWIDALPSFPSERSDRSRLFDAVGELLSGVEAIALDDLQWFDEASAALLHYVARSPQSRRILIAIGSRASELEENAAASRVIHDLSHSHRLQRLTLEPLDERDTVTLAQRVSSVADPGRIFVDGGGNPLFTIELARAARQGTPSYETLEELIGDRISELDPRARELVVWAAAVGRHFDVEILGRASGMPAGEMFTALALLERSSIIRPGEKRYDFTHDLVRQTAYRTLSGPRRWLVHRQIARALEGMHDPEGGLAGEIVHHATLAGEHQLAATACTVAGQRCLRLFAYTDAISVARRGLQLAETLPTVRRIAIEMELLHVLVLARSSRSDDRLALIPRINSLIAAARAQALPKVEALGSQILAILYEESEQLSNAAVETLRSSDSIRGVDDATAAAGIAASGRCLLLIQRDIPRAKELLVEAERLTGEGKAASVELPLGLGFLHAHEGNYDQAVPQLNAALEIATRDEDHWREWIATARLVTVALEQGDREAATRESDRLQSIASRMTGGSEGPRSEMLAALARYGEEGADHEVERCLGILREIDSKGDLAYAQTFLAELDFDQETPGARSRAEEALAAAELIGRSSEAALARSILAQLAARRGAHVEARALLTPALESKSWEDLTARSRDSVLRAAALLNIRRKEKEMNHGHNGAGTGV